MIINIDTSQPLSDEDKAALRALIGAGTTPAPTAKKAAAKKAAAAPEPEKAAEPEPEPEPEKAAEPEPEPEPEKAAEPEDNSDLRTAAVSRTSELLSNDGRPTVLKALKEIGAPKASAIPEDRLQEYIDLLDAAE
jgi:outer membrane biosynthesis protein TonB